MEVTNKFITTKCHINGAPHESDFEIKTATFSLSIESGSNDVVVKSLYLSMDPFHINRTKSYSSIQNTSSVVVGIVPGEAIDASFGVGRVVASGHPGFEKGDLVAGFISWGEYSLVKGANTLNKLDLMGFPLSYHAGILGLSGLTAYAGFFEVCKPKKGEKVFVSAASGSVGNLVGQYFPNGIDIYFDNVGAEMLEAAVDNMNTFGRVAAGGVISEYTDATKRAAPNMLEVVIKRITIREFLAPDHMNLLGDFISTTADHLRKGEIHVLEDISHGLESILAAFTGLFHGDNIGKTIVQITDE
ncbi:hypothetical protein RHMOL_Rhmol01G0063500 [Rhododendron molle]|uniref:Uncharacterized protein n=1 Tax=Rhododendron molle TaxID=49168 RepID=A0ACC0PZ68_RHOML|nr:hypothetical protein RHMOL_Rhmol01G0063500 [Rhododendron molle]